MSAREHKRNSVPWFLWPFVALWNLLTWILSLTGRLVAAILGVVFLILGIILTITVVLAPVGIPFTILGLLLMVRSIL